MKNFWKKLPKPILILAPMAGYTESPFRQLVKKIEPSTVLVSELISTEALFRGSEKTFDMCQFAPNEKNYFGIQLFGSKIDSFVKAAAEVEKLGADFIDINFGCPSPKILKSGSGSALLKTPELATELIVNLKKAVDIPITAKMRLGFFDDSMLLDTAESFAQAGISSLAIHGRTTTQKFGGTANWEKIYKVKERLKKYNIPVIGNGDIDSAEMAKEKLQNLDGIMIGRAAIKNPWIFSQCREIFDGKKVSPIPDLTTQVKFFQNIAQMSAENKPEKVAVYELRKHFVHFLRSFQNASYFRSKLMQAESLKELDEIFKKILEEE